MIFNDVNDDTIISNIETTNIELVDELTYINVIIEKILEIVKSTKTSTKFIMITLRNVFVQLRNEIAIKCLSSKET